MPRECSSRALARGVSTLAEAQHGVVARFQLLELGLGPGSIRVQLDRAQLHPVHRGRSKGFRARRGLVAHRGQVPEDEMTIVEGIPVTGIFRTVLGRFFEVDCLWRAQKLVVELDGRAVHGTELAFERATGRRRCR